MSVSKAAESGNQEEEENKKDEANDLAGWLIYRLDSALAVRTNQFKLLVVVLAVTNTGKKKPSLRELTRPP